MLGTHRVLAVLLLTAAVSISLSNSQGFFNRLFSKGAGYFSSSGPAHSRAPARTKATSSSSSWNATSGVHHHSPAAAAAASQSSRGFNNGGGGGGWGWNVAGGSFGAHHVSTKRLGHVSQSQTKASSRSVNMTGTGTGATSSSKKAVSEARGGGGGGGGWGWGWPQQHNNKGNTDYNMIIGALALLSLLGLGAFGFNRPVATNIVILNASGRRRRAADDFDDDMMEGETLPQFLNRMGKYLDMSWGEEKNLKKVEPLKLY